MNWAIFLSVLGGIAAFAAAIKAVPPIYESIRTFFQFLSGLSAASTVPFLVNENEDTQDKLDLITTLVAQLAHDLKEHMEEEERLRKEERNIVEELADTVLMHQKQFGHHIFTVASTVFKQVTYAEDSAFYLLEWDPEEERWVWSWGNPAYLRLTGLNFQEARNNQFWYSVAEEDRVRVRQVAEEAGLRHSHLEVSYTNVHLKTQEKTPVTLNASPLLGSDNTVYGYLGTIKTLDPQVQPAEHL